MVAEGFAESRREIVQHLAEMRTSIMADTRELIRQELAPIKNELTDIKMQLGQLSRRGTEDIAATNLENRKT